MAEPDHRFWTRHGAALLLALSSATATAYLLVAGRGTTFFFDEWEFVITRNHGFGKPVFRSHVGHPSLVPVAIYRVLFSVFGLRQYVPYRLTLIALHVLVCALLFVYARRRVPPLVALAMATMLLFFGSAWNDLIWPFQIGYLGSLVGLIGALLFLDRGDTRGDIGAGACLLMAVMSSGLGIPGVAAVAVHILLSPGRRRRIWIVAVPVLAYATIVLGISEEPSQLKLSNARLVPRFVATASTSVVRAAVGGGVVLAAVILLVGLGLTARRALTHPESRVQLAVLATLPLCFWVITGLARGIESPGASRYLYPGLLFLLLLAAETARGVRSVHPALTVALVAITGISAAVNVAPLREGRRFLVPISLKLRAELAALEIARPAGVDPAYRPETTWAPDIFAGPYFDVVDRFGSPTYGEATLARRPPQERYDADVVLVGAKTLRVAPAGALSAAGGAGTPPPVDQLLEGSMVDEGECRMFRPKGEAFATLTVPTRGVTVAAAGQPVEVAARRFGDVFVIEPLVVVPVGAGVSIVPAPDASRRLWHLQVRSAAAIRVCALDPPAAAAG